jgi:hypothetical protein
VTCKANAISIAAIVCAGLLVVIVSALLDLAILRHAITEHGHPLVSDMVALAIALAGLFVIGANASKFINVNRFSIHAPLPQSSCQDGPWGHARSACSQSIYELR